MAELVVGGVGFREVEVEVEVEVEEEVVAMPAPLEAAVAFWAK
jgi:hypothetical protein